MACPFFYATEKFAERRWLAHPQVPLGDPYDGECHARQDGYRPGDEELRNLCNLGYVRKTCPRFPQDAGPDAVRFSVSRDEQQRIVIRYVQERDHRPWEHGWLEYHVREQKFVQPHANRIVNRLAEAYAEAYLRRRMAPKLDG